MNMPVNPGTNTISPMGYGPAMNPGYAQAFGIYPQAMSLHNSVTDDTSMTPYTRIPPNENTRRPPGDDRSAQEIINDNPVLKHLGNQSGIRDKLNKLVGGNMYHDADQAFLAAAILTNIKSMAQANGVQRTPEQQGNGKIDGFTADGDARHGTEAGMLQDVCKYGLDHLVDANHRLDTTNDTHVRPDGTNMDNLEWGWQQFGAPILGLLSSGLGMIPNPVAQTLGGIGSMANGMLQPGAFSDFPSSANTLSGAMQQMPSIWSSMGQIYGGRRPATPTPIATSPTEGGATLAQTTSPDPDGSARPETPRTLPTVPTPLNSHVLYY